MYIIIYDHCVLAHLLAVLVLMPAALANRQVMFQILAMGQQEQSILPYNYWYVSVFRSHLLEKVLDTTRSGNRDGYLVQELKSSVWPWPYSGVATSSIEVQCLFVQLSISCMYDTLLWVS